MPTVSYTHLDVYKRQNYDLFNYYGAPDADRVMIAMGSVCDVADAVSYTHLDVYKRQEQVKLEISGPLSPVKVLPTEGSDFLYLVLPCLLYTSRCV